jgi:hypothetical protein
MTLNPQELFWHTQIGSAYMQDNAEFDEKLGIKA